LDCRAWINGQKLSDPHIADDTALLAENKESLQQTIDSTAAHQQEDAMEMQINAAKMEIQFVGKGQKSSNH